MAHTTSISIAWTSRDANCHSLYQSSVDSYPKSFWISTKRSSRERRLKRPAWKDWKNVPSVTTSALSKTRMRSSSDVVMRTSVEQSLVDNAKKWFLHDFLLPALINDLSCRTIFRKVVKVQHLVISPFDWAHPSCRDGRRQSS